MTGGEIATVVVGVTIPVITLGIGLYVKDRMRSKQEKREDMRRLKQEERDDLRRLKQEEAEELRRLKQEEREKLQTHFEELKAGVLDPMMSVAQRIASDSGLLVLQHSAAAADGVAVAPAGVPGVKLPAKFNFENTQHFVCCELHFPQISERWQRLKEDAARHNETYRKTHEEDPRSVPNPRSVKLRKFTGQRKKAGELQKVYDDHQGMKAKLLEDAEGIVKAFEEFAASSTNEISKIRKHVIEERFSKLDDCPVCQEL